MTYRASVIEGIMGYPVHLDVKISLGYSFRLRSNSIDVNSPCCDGWMYQKDGADAARYGKIDRVHSCGLCHGIIAPASALTQVSLHQMERLFTDGFARSLNIFDATLLSTALRAKIHDLAIDDYCQHWNDVITQLQDDPGSRYQSLDMTLHDRRTQLALWKDVVIL
jgi:hypothetical protein